MVIVDQFQFPRPVLVFMNFIDEQELPVAFNECISKINQLVIRKIKVLSGHIERLRNVQAHFDMLQNQRRFSHSTRTGDPDHTTFPVYI